MATTAELLALLAQVPVGSLFFLDYQAAAREHKQIGPTAALSLAAGLPATYYFGEFVRADLNQKGEPYLTLKVLNRRGEHRNFSIDGARLKTWQIMRLGPETEQR